MSSQRYRPKVPQKIKESFSSKEGDSISVGSKVMVLWTEKELDGTVFKPGWYEGEIQWRDDDNDTIGILYRKDVKKREGESIRALPYTGNCRWHFANQELISAKAWFKRRIFHAPNQILILVDSNEYVRLI